MKNYMLFDICPEFSEMFTSFYGGQFNCDVDQDLLTEQSAEIYLSYLKMLAETDTKHANEILYTMNLASDQAKLILSDHEDFPLIVRIAYGASRQVYEFLEYQYPGFGALNYLAVLDPLLLYVCGRYYYSIDDLNLARSSMFLSLCALASNSHNIEDVTQKVKYYEDHLDEVKQYIFADWLAVHPKVTFMIGQYYKDKKQYEKALEWFALGAKLDYEGRQSQEPFDRVAINEYELAMLYLQGLGTEKDYQEAHRWFVFTAQDIGSEHFPAFGDMYYEGLGVEVNKDFAFECYSHIFDDYDNYYFFELNDLQKERLRTMLQEKERNCKTSYDYHKLACIYDERFNDQDKFAELESLSEQAKQNEERAKSMPKEDKN